VIVYALLAHAFGLRHNRRAIEVIAGRQELLRIGVGRGFAAFQGVELDEGGGPRSGRPGDRLLAPSGNADCSGGFERNLTIPIL
jgi:hypothetical protein